MFSDYSEKIQYTVKEEEKTESEKKERDERLKMIVLTNKPTNELQAF